MPKIRALIWTEDGNQVFRTDCKVNGHDDLEEDIATFVHQLACDKGAINPIRLLRKIAQREHISLETVMDFLSTKSNVEIFIKEINKVTSGINEDIKKSFTRSNVKQALIETFKIEAR